jgi:hypothetical protein
MIICKRIVISSLQSICPAETEEVQSLNRQVNCWKSTLQWYKKERVYGPYSMEYRGIISPSRDVKL